MAIRHSLSAIARVEAMSFNVAAHPVRHQVADGAAGADALLDLVGCDLELEHVQQGHALAKAGQPGGSNFAMTTSVTGEAPGASCSSAMDTRATSARTACTGRWWEPISWAPDSSRPWLDWPPYASLGAGEIPADFDHFALREYSVRVYPPFTSRSRARNSRLFSPPNYASRC
jgi:hypothetical protein